MITPFYCCLTYYLLQMTYYFYFELLLTAFNFFTGYYRLSKWQLVYSLYLMQYKPVRSTCFFNCFCFSLKQLPDIFLLLLTSFRPWTRYTTVASIKMLMEQTKLQSYSRSSFIIFDFNCPKKTIPSKQVVVGSGTGKFGQVKLVFSPV